MQYVDHNNNVTDKYPYNPNGSHNGIAAVCSIDGRHLAMMPHPERCFLNWQMPWKPYDKDNKKFYSPWFLMFKNAFNWRNKY
jgi:phosphoribosylformylglycinamidine synthase